MKWARTWPRTWKETKRVSWTGGGHVVYVLVTVTVTHQLLFLLVSWCINGLSRGTHLIVQQLAGQMEPGNPVFSVSFLSLRYAHLYFSLSHDLCMPQHCVGSWKTLFRHRCMGAATVFDHFLEGNTWYAAYNFHKLFCNPKQVTLLYVQGSFLAARTVPQIICQPPHIRIHSFTVNRHVAETARKGSLEGQGKDVASRDVWM